MLLRNITSKTLRPRTQILIKTNDSDLTISISAQRNLYVLMFEQYCRLIFSILREMAISNCCLMERLCDFGLRKDFWRSSRTPGIFSLTAERGEGICVESAQGESARMHFDRRSGPRQTEVFRVDSTMKATVVWPSSVLHMILILSEQVHAENNCTWKEYWYVWREYFQFFFFSFIYNIGKFYWKLCETGVEPDLWGQEYYPIMLFCI